MIELPDDLRVLTVRQPWASLIIHGNKDVENRDWRFPSTIPLPARIAVHAAAGEPESYEYLPQATTDQLPRGCVLGVVTVVRCNQDEDSPWARPGAWHWRLAYPQALVHPVRTRGRLGLLPVPHQVLTAMRRADLVQSCSCEQGEPVEP